MRISQASHDQIDTLPSWARAFRERARKLGLSDAEVAKLSGLGQARYSNYVTGLREPSLDVFVSICRALQTTPNEVLGFGAPDTSAPAARSDPRSGLVGAMRLLADDRISLARRLLAAIVAEDRSRGVVRPGGAQLSDQKADGTVDAGLGREAVSRSPARGGRKPR